MFITSAMAFVRRRPFRENETRIVDDRNFLHRIEASEVVGHVLEISQRDLFRLEWNAGHPEEHVHRPARL